VLGDLGRKETLGVRRPWALGELGTFNLQVKFFFYLLDFLLKLRLLAAKKQKKNISTKKIKN
jgi:hypothetical protein